MNAPIDAEPAQANQIVCRNFLKGLDCSSRSLYLRSPLMLFSFCLFSSRAAARGLRSFKSSSLPGFLRRTSAGFSSFIIRCPAQALREADPASAALPPVHLEGRRLTWKLSEERTKSARNNVNRIMTPFLFLSGRTILYGTPQSLKEKPPTK